MAEFLHIYHNDGLVKTLDLVPGKRYVIGRKKSCDFVLDDYKGISREHFEIVEELGQWKLQVLSQFGTIEHDGASLKEILFTETKEFELPPYKFVFMVQVEREPVVEVDHSQVGSNPELEDNSDRTVVGNIAAIPYLKTITNAQSKAAGKKLDGNSPWLIGRDPACAFVVDDQQVSRNQFEILKRGNAFYIKDLGSVNGTVLNGHRLPAQKEHSLSSGDLIQVLDHIYEFEIHDREFEERIDANALVVVNEEYQAPQTNESYLPNVVGQSPYVIAPTYGSNNTVAFPNAQPYAVTYGNSAAPEFPEDDKKKKIFRLAIGAIAAIAILAGVFQDDDQVVDTASKAESKEMSPIAALSPDQQSLVKQNHNLAKNYFMQGKYASAKGEIVKLKEVIPEYLDSEEILKLSEEAIHMQEQKIKAEQIEIAQKETEEKIQKRVGECRKLINPQVQSQQIEDCLSDVLQFNPEHPQFVELRMETEKIVSARAVKDAERKKFQGMVSALRGVYEKAVEQEKKTDPLKAISAYEKVAESKLPDPQGLKNQAQRKISSIKTNMNAQGAKFLIEAEQLHAQNKTRNAVFALRRAQKANPLDEEIQGKIDVYTKELRKKAMELYQEGILEESYGNIEGAENKPGAKDKWKEILNLDVPDGEYYRKASMKLKKYGAF
ncbi:MAG: FHA domain-containing protein [Bdellovibrionota bacterium]